MGLPESWGDKRLVRRLSWVMGRNPQYVVIIGYSFAQFGSGYDDSVSLAYFIEKFKSYRGPIFVVSPDPGQLCEMLSDALKIKSVYPIKRYWNILAHAFVESLRLAHRFPSLDYASGALYDRFGSGRTFPIPDR